MNLFAMLALRLVRALASSKARPAERRTEFCADAALSTGQLALRVPPPRALRLDAQLMGAASVAVEDDHAPQTATQGVAEPDTAWRLDIVAARLAWGRLTETDLRSSEGRVQRLAALVQERYALNPEDALKRVLLFLEKQKH